MCIAFCAVCMKDFYQAADLGFHIQIFTNFYSLIGMSHTQSHKPNIEMSSTRSKNHFVLKIKSVADIRRVILIDWATYFDHLVNAKNQLILGNTPYHGHLFCTYSSRLCSGHSSPSYCSGHSDWTCPAFHRHRRDQFASAI